MHDPHQFLPFACRAAARILHCPLLAEEAGERAVHLLTLAMLDGTPPAHPKSWLRTVARRSACRLLRSDWVRTPSMRHDEITRRQAPFRAPSTASGDEVRETMQRMLSPRQFQALDAALSTPSTRAAARRCGMQPRDFRRYLRRITKMARDAFAHHDGPDPFADDPAVQFRLPS
ncbi:MAG: sigma-70 family RNA polymerase sigma factor [Planctomycetes bacterium]|nr:sigma-70 family RNA polymerase sigma factor [Planctomycetota bacterium]